eukprot:8310825-Alexandrium_andersonii.AAC.1
MPVVPLRLPGLVVLAPMCGCTAACTCAAGSELLYAPCCWLRALLFLSPLPVALWWLGWLFALTAHSAAGVS